MNDSDADIKLEKFRDMIVVLNSGIRLITRLIEDTIVDEDENIIENQHFMYQPCELFRTNDDRLIMAKWIPETTDLIIPIPIEEVLTIVTPDDEILKHYLQSIQVIPTPTEMPNQSIH